MRLRTQLVLASLLLAILPVAALVLYSYRSSKDAIESANRREAARMTRQMNARVDSIRSELDTRMAAVTAIPIESIEKGGAATERRVADEIAAAMGAAAPLVESVEFLPVAIPDAPAVTAGPAPPAPATARPVRRWSGTYQVQYQGRPPASGSGGSTLVDGAVPPPPPPPGEASAPAAAVPADAAAPVAAVSPAPWMRPIVVKVPPVPAFKMPPEADSHLAEITRLGNELTANPTMPAEERDRKLKELKAHQNEFHKLLRGAQEEWRRQRQTQAKEREIELRAAEGLEGQERRVIRVEEAEAATEVRAVTQVAGAAMAAFSSTHDAASKQETGAGEKAGTNPVASTNGKATPSKTAKPATGANAPERTAEDHRKEAERARRVSLIFGREFNVPVESDGRVVGRISAQVKPEEVVSRVLGAPGDDDSEIPFALDADGHLYARTDKERQQIERLGVVTKLKNGEPLSTIDPNWVVAVSRSGNFRVGVARRVGDTFDELRRAAGRNVAWGLGLVFVAILGIVPIANHMTRDVQLVTAGAERISQGDLQTRLPVRSKNEFGQLASAFNRMAHDLSEQRQKLHQEELARRDQLVQQRILERKAAELEEARDFQLSLLPKSIPRHGRYDIAVFTRTATEVGGDYYDFHAGADGMLSITIGDATGHGAKAGTMVTVIKTLFAGYTGQTSPGAFLGEATERIKRMELGRMAMALSLARFESDRIVAASAGMPPILIHRAATGTVEEVAFEATPLGTLETVYGEKEVPVGEGDTILLMSDGFPELLNSESQQLGYTGAAEAFERAAGADAATVIDRLVAVARSWHGDQPPNDDITFVAVRVKGNEAAARV